MASVTNRGDGAIPTAGVRTTNGGDMNNGKLVAFGKVALIQAWQGWHAYEHEWVKGLRCGADGGGNLGLGRR